MRLANLLTGLLLIVPVVGKAQVPSSGADQPSGDAQAATTDLNTIVVTGSRIARTTAGTVQPASVIDAAQIAARGYTNIADALAENPAFGPQVNSLSGGQAPFGVGESIVDFFSLGGQRTLTLIDGHRFVSSDPESILSPSSGSTVDLNLIPESLVQRAEVIAVGGAPVYGSDAIAGTVNIILKRNFKGFEIDGLNGISERGDGAEHRISAIAGASFADGRGHIVLSGQWNKGASLSSSARRDTSSDGAFFDSPSDPNSPYGQQIFSGFRYNTFTAFGVPVVGDDLPQFAGVHDANGDLLAFNAQGRLVPYNLGTQTGSLYTSAGGDGFRADDYGNLRARYQRTLGTMLASFKVSDALNLYLDGWYARSSATTPVGSPYYSTVLNDSAGTHDGNFVLSLNNPFLSSADRATIAANLDSNGDGVPDSDTFFLGRANTDLYPDKLTTVERVYRFVGGAKGDFRLFGRPWTYDASLNYGRSRDDDYSHEVVAQNLFNALDATLDADGAIVCAPGYVSAAIRTQSTTCAPFDPFGQSNTATQRAAIAYITAPSHSHSVNSMFDATATIGGTIFTLPGGDAAISLGYEHRREALSFVPSAYYAGIPQPDGSVASFGELSSVPAVSGAFETNEGFGEIRLPIVSPRNDVPFLNRLELEGAVRYVQNSLEGGGWTYTGGGTLAPIEDISFRGNYTRSIRAPQIANLVGPATVQFGGGRDPCDARFINGGPDPARRAANCAAAGITQPFTSNFVDFGAPELIEGNRDLKNERADSYTVGVVLRPRFLPGLTLSSDYVSIRIGNAIVGVLGSTLLNACYDAASFPNTYCSQITRDADGQITMLKEGPGNAAVTRLKAVTSELAYRFDLRLLGLAGDPGALDITVNYYHLIDQYTRVGLGDLTEQAGEVGNPRDSFVANVTYSRKKLSLLWQTQFIGPSLFNPSDAPNTLQYPGVPHWFLFNATATCDVDPRLTLRLIVDNVLDTKAPRYAVAGAGDTAVETYYSGVIGRSFKISASARF
jgi:iron complex outermembrane receptor protein